MIFSPWKDSICAAKKASFTDAAAGVTPSWPAGPPCVLVWATVDAYVEVGEGAVAADDDTPVPANQVVYIAVPAGGGGNWRVSARAINKPTPGAAPGVIYAKPGSARDY